MIKEGKLKNNIGNKVFLLVLKFILHILGLCYVLYTALGFLGIDAIIIGYFAHVSVFTWIVLYLLSKKFKFCYVHRLPLYYIATNDSVTVIDTYFTISDDYYIPLVIQSILFGGLILGYSLYYIECRNVKDNKKFIKSIYQ